MPMFEFKVILAPRKAEKIKGVRGHDERYAHTLMNKINALGIGGWEYLRAESLPVDEKSSMMGKSVEKYLSVMVFRREKETPPPTSTYTPASTPDQKPISDMSMLDDIGEDMAGDTPERGTN